MKRAEIRHGAKTLAHVRVANSFFSRLKGLLGTSELLSGDGLLIEPCDSVHMWGMKYPIDVAFLDQENKVIALIGNFKPGRASRIYWKAKRTLELASGELREVKVGDSLQILVEEATS
ncbi:MAG TPA: DUF192 domain-containing protein [Cyanobacteria bacterium UBA8530]|nr:DUF192 domain-containing protein [Cyanobacteria bacterium UBA8530]